MVFNEISPNYNYIVFCLYNMVFNINMMDDMDAWMNGWIDRWMNSWIDAWMHTEGWIYTLMIVGQLASIKAVIFEIVVLKFLLK